MSVTPSSTTDVKTNPQEVLRRHHRERRLAGLIGALGFTLAAVACVIAENLGWWRAGYVCGMALAIVAVLLLGWWCVAQRRWSRIGSAQTLDRKWEMKARLETVLELETRDSELATALRTDVARRVADRRSPLALWWFSALAFTALAALVLLTEFGTTAFLALRSKMNAPAPAKPAPAPPPDDAAKPQNQPSPREGTLSEITWISPASQSRATAMESVETKARAETQSGLRNAVMRLSVNGGKPIDRPFPADVAARIGNPGTHELEQTIHLDEFSLNEFDLVTYFIRAERIGTEPAAEIDSPLQFIQIRPAHEETGNGGDPSPLIAKVYHFQIAQIQLLQRNFIQTTARIDHANTVWRDPNKTLAADQSGLAGEVDDFLGSRELRSAPAELAELVRKAQTAMGRAGETIAQEENQSALAMQQEALAALTECDRFFRKSNKAQVPPPVADPFRDRENFALKARSETPAGKLEKLADEQDKLVSALSDPNADLPGAQAKEAANANQAKGLSEKGGFGPEAKAAAERGSAEAETAVRRLAAADRSSALSAAAASSQALHEAVAALETLGKQSALEDFENERRALNASARMPVASDRTSSLAQIIARLERDADYQQQHGSAEAARTLAQFANATRALGNASPQSEAWRKGLAVAAAGEISLTTPEHAAGLASRQLGRGQAALKDNRDVPARADFELAAQLGGELLSNADQNLARDVEHDAAAGSASSTTTSDLARKADQLSAALAKLSARRLRDERVKRFSADDVEPAYRPAVERYFEQLSREGAAK